MKLFSLVIIAICMNLCSNAAASESTDINEFIEAIRSRHVKIIFYSAQRCGGFTITGPTDLKGFLSQIEANLTGTKKTIILFNETFFGSNVLPLDSANGLLSEFQSLSQRHTGVMFCINFILEFPRDKRPYWLPEDGTIVPSKDLIEIENSSSVEGIDLVDIFKDESLSAQKVANCSLLIWNGQVVLFYRKSSYFKECDALCTELDSRSKELVRGTHTYEFGDWTTHVLPSLVAEVGDLPNLLSFRTCFDIVHNSGLPSSGCCIVLANQAPSSVVAEFPVPIKKGVLECRSSGGFNELNAGDIALICDSHASSTPSCWVVYKVDGETIRLHICQDGTDNTIDKFRYQKYSVEDLSDMIKEMQKGECGCCSIM